MKKQIKDLLLTAGILSACFLCSLITNRISQTPMLIPMFFVLGVFLISVLTSGYRWGVAASLISVLAVNYAFTFPYFVLNFTIPVNLISGIIMVAIAVLTSALTTKLKQHEAMKVESEKERMRANLLRAVSHDLRTPLTTIYGSSTTLLENSGGMTEAQKEKILTGIKEDTQWLIRMVENLLSVTRIDSGQVKLVKSPTVLEELVDSVILKFKKRYPDQKVDIHIPEDMVVIPMDAILIEQVIVNILENAVQHAGNMTKLTLQVFTLGKQAVFEISDNGLGIDPGDRFIRPIRRRGQDPRIGCGCQ